MTATVIANTQLAPIPVNPDAAARAVGATKRYAATAGLKPVEGGRLVLRPFPTVSVNRLATEVGGLRVAPWPRVYVDLLHAGVRGEDAAEHLKEVVRER